MLSFITNNPFASKPLVRCVSQKNDISIINYFTGIHSCDFSKNTLFVNYNKCTPVVVLLANNISQNDANLWERYSCRDITVHKTNSFFQIDKSQTQPTVTINSIEASFNYLYKNWSDEIKFQSSVDNIIGNVHYIKILSLGWKVVPYIIGALKRKPNHLFIALSEITGENPVKPEHCGKIKDITMDWIEWWNKKSYAVD
jgi:hypothetical protein